MEPFVRGDESTGSGLGLAIVARLLPLLGGRLSIDSEPGRGTQVRVRLPAA
ncbi:MAG TPA: ATP-binding protein [Candidatus Binatia bacterium]|nr:ATP-binding protein [Candidatus Binatia bacterium]